MKGVGVLAVTVLSSLSQALCAQAGDAVDRLKACAQFEGMERLKCVDELLGEMIEKPDSTQPQGTDWNISETTSPVDYRPQIAAHDGASVVARRPVLARHPLPQPANGTDNFHDGFLETGHRG